MMLPARCESTHGGVGSPRHHRLVFNIQMSLEACTKTADVMKGRPKSRKGRSERQQAGERDIGRKRQKAREREREREAMK